MRKIEIAASTFWLSLISTPAFMFATFHLQAIPIMIVAFIRPETFESPYFWLPYIGFFFLYQWREQYQDELKRRS